MQKTPCNRCGHNSYPYEEHFCGEYQQDELAEEKVECFRCGEVVARIETEDSVCNWCLEVEHEMQERHR